MNTIYHFRSVIGKPEHESRSMIFWHQKGAWLTNATELR